MRLFLGLLAASVVWAGFKLDKRRKQRGDEIDRDVSRWEDEGGGVAPKEAAV
jgi:hypothetical protein